MMGKRGKTTLLTGGWSMVSSYGAGVDEVMGIDGGSLRMVPRGTDDGDAMLQLGDEPF